MHVTDDLSHGLAAMRGCANRTGVGGRHQAGQDLPLLIERLNQCQMRSDRLLQWLHCCGTGCITSGHAGLQRVCCTRKDICFCLLQRTSLSNMRSSASAPLVMVELCWATAWARRCSCRAVHASPMAAKTEPRFLTKPVPRVSLHDTSALGSAAAAATAPALGVNAAMQSVDPLVSFAWSVCRVLTSQDPHLLLGCKQATAIIGQATLTSSAVVGAVHKTGFVGSAPGMAAAQSNITDQPRGVSPMQSPPLIHLLSAVDGGECVKSWTDRCMLHTP